MFLKKYRTTVAEQNYSVNQHNSETDQMINGQSAYSNYLFGLTTLDRVGCGIIAVYNALRLLGRPKKLTNLIREFETNNTETIPFGFFGINPFSMRKYYEAHQIPYRKIFRVKEFDKAKEENGVFVMTFWNDSKNLMKGAHTVTFCCINNQFDVFNRTNGNSESVKFDNAGDIIGNGRLICGYRLYETFHAGEVSKND